MRSPCSKIVVDFLKFLMFKLCCFSASTKRYWSHGQPKTKLVSSPIMDNSVVPLYQFWLHDSGKDQTETTSSWLKFWKLNLEKFTLNPRSIRFLGNSITSEFLRFPVYNTRNFHTICFRSFFRKFWRKDIAGEFVLCYGELFFFFS